MSRAQIHFSHIYLNKTPLPRLFFAPVALSAHKPPFPAKTPCCCGCLFFLFFPFFLGLFGLPEAGEKHNNKTKNKQKKPKPS